MRQTAAGIYAWLPAGHRVLCNIARIVREEQDAAGAQELLMPTMQSADLWRESGRYDAYGPEMLRIKDRHQRDLLYGPTNEEMITDIYRSAVHSYRELPQMAYHIQWKFRDEVRPRFGVMRGREFLMKDAYSFDLDYAGAVVSYRRMMLAYMRTFQRLGLQAIPMVADTGPIGGDLSHEFIILAPNGESQVFFDAAFEEIDYSGNRFSHGSEADLQRFFDLMTTNYAATDEKHDVTAWEQVAPDRRREGRASRSATSSISAPSTAARWASTSPAPTAARWRRTWQLRHRRQPPRRRADRGAPRRCGIIWPDSVAPFAAAILNLKPGDAACDGLCEALYAKLGARALYDDRDERAGRKFADADLMGHPWQIVVGPRGAAAGKVELKRRQTGDRHEVSPDEALERL